MILDFEINLEIQLKHQELCIIATLTKFCLFMNTYFEKDQMSITFWVPQVLQNSIVSHCKQQITWNEIDHCAQKKAGRKAYFTWKRPLNSAQGLYMALLPSSNCTTNMVKCWYEPGLMVMATDPTRGDPLKWTWNYENKYKRSFYNYVNKTR